MRRSGIWYSALVAVIITIAGASWWGTSFIERVNREGVGQALTTVLETTEQAFESWSESQRATADVWAQSARVLQVTQRLLAVEGSRASLQADPAQAALRALLTPVLEASHFEGFFIIDPANINRGSTRDSNLAATNLLSEQPEIARRLWEGEVLLSRPQFSDVALEARSGGQAGLPATMFVGAPIRDATGKAIALLTFRINPARDFSAIFQRGRIGDSGETYAFDAEGHLLSESRFPERLVRIGLLREGESPIRRVQVRDPGRELIEPPGPERDWPLTLMARAAVGGHAGMNLEGYRDYRGVQVVGAWSWNSTYRFGITTEIDSAEAYRNAGAIRLTVFSLAGLSIIIMIIMVVSFQLTRRAIDESERRYRGLIEGSSQAIVLHKDFSPILANQAFAELFGFEGPAEVLRRGSVADLLGGAGDEGAGDPRRPRDDASSGGNRRFELETRTLHNDKLQVEVFERPLHWKGELVTADTLVNVTEQRQLEQQLRQSQKMDAIGRLAGGVAHDFNNTLQVVRGFSEIAKGATDEGTRLRAMETILKATESAAHLTRQMLSFSRKATLQKTNVDLNELVLNQLKLTGRILGEHIEVSTALDAEPATVLADTVMIEQALLNLCINARDAMPGGGKLTITSENFVVEEHLAEFHPGLAPGEYVLLTVTDTGTGMSPKVRDQIFEPFFTTKEESKGTGLGLSTVYGILLQHGGVINVYSELGLGTSMKVFLPLSTDAVQVVGSMEPALEIPRGTETLLIAEDEEAVALLLREILESLGYTVLRAADGAEAIRMFGDHRERVDMAILDMVMPKFDGRYVYERLRQLSPDLPMIFSTGYTGDIVDAEFIEEHDITILRKPYSSAQLAQAVRHALDQGRGVGG